MSFQTSDFDECVMLLASGVVNDRVLNLLSHIINAEAFSTRFVRAIISRRSSTGVQAEDAVVETMRILENLAGESEEIAVILMRCLRPFADELMMHDIHDSIDLWVSHHQFG
jgi:hypothetical protein